MISLNSWEELQLVGRFLVNSQPSTHTSLTSTLPPPPLTPSTPPSEHPIGLFEPRGSTIKSQRCQHVLFHSQLSCEVIMWSTCVKHAWCLSCFHFTNHTHTHTLSIYICNSYRLIYTAERTFYTNMNCKLHLKAAHSHVCTFTESTFTTDDDCEEAGVQKYIQIIMRISTMVILPFLWRK